VSGQAFYPADRQARQPQGAPPNQHPCGITSTGSVPSDLSAAAAPEAAGDNRSERHNLKGADRPLKVGIERNPAALRSITRWSGNRSRSSLSSLAESMHFEAYEGEARRAGRRRRRVAAHHCDRGNRTSSCRLINANPAIADVSSPASAKLAGFFC